MQQSFENLIAVGDREQGEQMFLRDGAGTIAQRRLESAQQIRDVFVQQVVSVDRDHRRRPHLGRVNMTVGQGDALQGRHEGIAAVEALGQAKCRIQTGDRMDRPAVMRGRQFRRATYREARGLEKPFGGFALVQQLDRLLDDGVGRGLFDKTYETFHRLFERDQLDHMSFP